MVLLQPPAYERLHRIGSGGYHAERSVLRLPRRQTATNEHRPAMRRILSIALLLGLMLLVPAAPGRASDLSIESLEAAIQRVEADPSLEDAVRTATLATLREAADFLRRAERSAIRARELEQQISDAPALLDRLRENLARPVPVPEISAPIDATRAELERFLTQAIEDVEAAKRRVDELTAELQALPDRRSQLPLRLAERRNRLGELGPITSEPLTEPDRAAHLRDRAERRLLLNDIERLERETAFSETARTLLPLQRDQAARRVTEAERIAAAWQALVSDRRQADAEATRRETDRLREEAARRSPTIAALADHIASMTAESDDPQSLTVKIDHTERRLQSVRADVRRLLDEARSVERRLSVSGVNEATGLLLIRQSRTLPSVVTLRRSIRDHRASIARTEYQLIVFEDERATLSDIDARLAELLRSETFLDAEHRTEVERIGRELLVLQRATLDQSIDDLRRLQERLVELEAAEASLLRVSEAFEDFIAERLFWVRSVGGPLIPSVDTLKGIAAWTLDHNVWRTSAERVVNKTLRNPGPGLIALLLVTALFAIRRRVDRRMTVLAEKVSRQRTDSFIHTLEAVFHTVIGALPVPALLHALAWLLSRPPEMPEFAVAGSIALRTCGTLLIPYLIAARLLRSSGLASAHFRWPAEAVRHARRQLRWFIPAIIPPIFVLMMMIVQSVDERWNASIGRIAFITLMLLVALFWRRMLHSDRPLAKALFSDQSSLGGRLRPVWSILLVAVPIATAIITGLGYYITALSLQAMIINTIWLLIAAFVIHAVLMRWLFIARRRLAIETARRARESAASQPAENVTAASDVTMIEDAQLNIPELDIRTRKLIQSFTALVLVIGLYGIWANMLPALRMLERVQIWPAVQVLEATESPATGTFSRVIASRGSVLPGNAEAVEAENRDPVQTDREQTIMIPGMTPPKSLAATEITPSERARSGRVTLADLGMALIILLATLAAVRNVPGLVEIIVLQRLSLDAGTRNAVTTIVRYAITMIGLTVGLGTLGITWTSIQWLAAALTFGLAFGLQEIFANFISGIILLLERPIRVGDVVTTNNVSGTVACIRMRATTIIDFDRKELIVPNRTFITDQIINWTLSDPILRLVVPVGLSYGADVDRAERVLLEIARNQSAVLTDPAPSVVFQRFGDSTLDFDLRVFLPHISELIPTRHALHRAILERFRAEGIEIAFPQRDLHIRSAPGLQSEAKAVLGRPVVDADAIGDASEAPRDLPPRS